VIRVGQALLLSIVDLFHPRLIKFLFLPIAMGLILAFGFWSLLIDSVQELAVSALGFFAGLEFLPNMIRQFLQSEGLLIGASAVMLFLLAVVLLPLVIMVLVWLSSFFVMPVIHRHLEVRHGLSPIKKGQSISLDQIRNLIMSVAIYFMGTLVALFFWFFPPLMVLGTFLNLSYFNYRVFLDEALVEHASSAELAQLKATHRLELFGLSVVLTGVSLIPLGVFFVPLYGGLLFCHWGFRRLSEQRS
jgi:hypothetical protein